MPGGIRVGGFQRIPSAVILGHGAALAVALRYGIGGGHLLAKDRQRCAMAVAVGSAKACFIGQGGVSEADRAVAADRDADRTGDGGGIRGEWDGQHSKLPCGMLCPKGAAVQMLTAERVTQNCMQGDGGRGVSIPQNFCPYREDKRVFGQRDPCQRACLLHDRGGGGGGKSLTRNRDLCVRRAAVKRDGGRVGYAEILRTADTAPCDVVGKAGEKSIIKEIAVLQDWLPTHQCIDLAALCHVQGPALGVARAVEAVRIRCDLVSVEGRGGALCKVTLLGVFLCGVVVGVEDLAVFIQLIIGVRLAHLADVAGVAHAAEGGAILAAPLIEDRRTFSVFNKTVVSY